MKTIELTRRRVAREEIETAIDLVFTNGSLAVAHLLGWAAVDVIRGVANKLGLETLHGRIEEIIIPEKISEWRRLLREPYVFSKHSDRDPDLVIDSFKPDSAFLILLVAIIDYGTVYKQLTTKMFYFRAWALTKFPNFIVTEFKDRLIAGAEKIFGVDADLASASRAYSELVQLLPALQEAMPAQQRKITEI
jgi:hypothetical protein